MEMLGQLLMRSCSSVACNHGRILGRGYQKLQTRTLRATLAMPYEKNSNEENSYTGSTVNDDIHKAIAGNKTSFKDEKKPWVGFNPFREPIPSDWMSFLSQKIDWETFVEDKLEARKMEKLRTMQMYSTERRQILGGELAAARFVVAMNGKVKLYNDSHIYSSDTAKIKFLPSEKTPGLFVEAIDLSNTQLIYEGIENLFQMEALLQLNLSNCPRLDEWSISLLGVIPSLVSLNLSNSSFLTERSLIPLQHIPNLQRLNLCGIKYFMDVPLPLIFLEELLPNCVISTDADSSA